MTARKKKVVRVLAKNIRTRAPRIRKKSKKAASNPALVLSLAKYYRALDRLAKE